IVVLIGVCEGSWSPSLSTGNDSLDQITDECAPGRVETTLLTRSSINTLALPLASWPVTTRRIVMLMPRPFLLLVSPPACGPPRARAEPGPRQPRWRSL